MCFSAGPSRRGRRTIPQKSTWRSTSRTIPSPTYDPTQFEDEEKKRVLAAIDEKIAGKKIVTSERGEPVTGGNVVDMMAALKATRASCGALN